ncbi:glycosyltransferase family 2 protein [Sphingobium yanoikuyae]|nr:glycosyltransferase [Sphingobium yanoikuyae]
MPDISVIIPHYSDLDRLDRCLAALQAQTMAAHRFEIIVADNMSPIGKLAVENAIAGRARLIMAPEKGAGPARNAGVAASAGELLAFTDADCLPDPNWLEAGIAALDGCDLVGGRMIVVPEHDRPRSGAEAFETVFAFDNESYVRDKGFTVTANLFCSRSVFDATGPFRVGLSEDTDWCLRARDLGFRITYAERAVVGHPPRPDWPSLRRKWERMHAEMFALALLQPGGRRKWVVHMLAMPPSILAHGPRLLRSPALTDTGERWRGLVLLTRLRLWRFFDGILRAGGMRR